MPDQLDAHLVPRLGDRQSRIRARDAEAPRGSTRPPGQRALFFLPAGNDYLPAILDGTASIAPA